MRSASTLPFLLAIVACGAYRAKVQEPSPLVQPVSSVPDRAPAGQALVFFHRVFQFKGQESPVTVWDGPVFLGELESGHGCFRVCKPGQHYFVSRSQGRVGVVEAELAAGRVYDFMFDLKTGWDTVDSVISPVTQDDERRSDIPKLLVNLTYFEPKPVSFVREYEAAQRAETLRIIKDFTKGEKRDRLGRLKADDHR